MRIIIEGPPGQDDPPRPLGRRLAWLLGLALCAVGAVAILAYGLKALLSVS